MSNRVEIYLDHFGHHSLSVTIPLVAAEFDFAKNVDHVMMLSAQRVKTARMTCASAQREIEAQLRAGAESVWIEAEDTSPVVAKVVREGHAVEISRFRAEVTYKTTGRSAARRRDDGGEHWRHSGAAVEAEHRARRTVGTQWERIEREGYTLDDLEGAQ